MLEGHTRITTSGDVSVSARPVAWLAVSPNLGELMCLAASGNPYLPEDEVLDRVVVGSQVGLLVGGNTSAVTLLYLWTDAMAELSPWMAHLSQWLEYYPHWRKAHGLGASSEAVRIVLAAPGLGDGVRSALRLITCHTTPVRYGLFELEGKLVLGWERGEAGTAGPRSGLATTVRASFDTSGADALTAEERAFFYQDVTPPIRLR